MSEGSVPSQRRGPAPSQGAPRFHCPCTFLPPRSGQKDASNINQTHQLLLKLRPPFSLGRHPGAPHGPRLPPSRPHLPSRVPSSRPLARVHSARGPGSLLASPGDVTCRCSFLPNTPSPHCLLGSAPSTPVPHHHLTLKLGWLSRSGSTAGREASPRRGWSSAIPTAALGPGQSPEQSKCPANSV